MTKQKFRPLALHDDDSSHLKPQKTNVVEMKTNKAKKRDEHFTNLPRLETEIKAFSVVVHAAAVFSFVAFTLQITPPWFIVSPKQILSVGETMANISMCFHFLTFTYRTVLLFLKSSFINILFSTNFFFRFLTTFFNASVSSEAQNEFGASRVFPIH